MAAHQSGGKQPWSKSFWEHYECDEDLREASFAAQGLWMRMLCIMARAEPYGCLLTGTGRAIDLPSLARKVGAAVDEIAPLLDELERCNVFSRRSDGVIYCRRLVRDRAVYLFRSANGKKGGRRPQVAAGEVEAREIGPDGLDELDQVEQPEPAAKSSLDPGLGPQLKPEHNLQPKPQLNPQLKLKPKLEPKLQPDQQLSSRVDSIDLDSLDSKEEVSKKVSKIHLPSEEGVPPSNRTDLFGETHEPERKQGPLGKLQPEAWDQLRDIVGGDDRGEAIKLANKFLAWSEGDLDLMIQVLGETHAKLPHKKPIGIFCNLVSDHLNRRRLAQKAPAKLRLVSDKGSPSPRPAPDPSDPFGIAEWCRSVPGAVPITLESDRHIGAWRNEHGCLDYWAKHVIDAAGFPPDWNGARRGNLNYVLQWMAMGIDPNDAANKIREEASKQPPGSIFSLKWFDDAVRSLRRAA